jgi:anaerobic ribonucleoside-triphosphate reductase activating protein
MEALISRTHYPVTVLGPGRRAGIWFQGCSIRCVGCVSLDTWGFDPHAAVEMSAILEWLATLPLTEIDGVTISGGEPTDQPAALAELLGGIGCWRERRPPELPTPDVLVFTGRDPSWLQTPAAAVLRGADAVVAGPYEVALAGASPLRGSENQQLVTMTPLGRERFAAEALATRSVVQVELTTEGLWVIGIPRPGDLAAFEAASAARGVVWNRRSWRS